jgi:hypothetical protein
MSIRLLIIAAAVLGLIGLAAVAVLLLLALLRRMNPPPWPDEHE